MMLFAPWEQIRKYLRGIIMEIRIYANVTTDESAEVVVIDESGSELCIATKSLESATEISGDLKGVFERHGL
tara:strand:- start:789 stop:1004 length:216 start_codon:yes stop_codon:yes gene_type:complete